MEAPRLLSLFDCGPWGPSSTLLVATALFSLFGNSKPTTLASWQCQESAVFSALGPLPPLHLVLGLSCAVSAQRPWGLLSGLALFFPGLLARAVAPERVSQVKGLDSGGAQCLWARSTHFFLHSP